MPSAWADARELLCVRLDGIGDLLMTTPAIRALREARTGRRITLLTSPAGAAAARAIPEIDDVIVFRAPWMKPAPDAVPHDMDLIRNLAERKLDGAVIFTVYSQNPLPAAYLCYLAGVPLRLAHCRENPYRLLTDWVPDPEPLPQPRHEVRRQLDLVATIGCRTADETLTFHLAPDACKKAAQRLASLGLDAGRPLVIAHSGASAPSRRYPAERFAAALRMLAPDCEIVLTGDAAERELVTAIRASLGPHAHSLAGELDLATLGALIAAADVLISNNTAPAHIAAAVGTPVVDLYALTNPQHTPWQVEHRLLNRDVPCRWCYKSVCPLGHHDCLRLVPPQDVASAARELLARRPALRAASR